MCACACAQVLARLVLDHPGVRHRCVADAAEAADHVSQLTKALATQPFKVQVCFLQPTPCVLLQCIPCPFGPTARNSIARTWRRMPPDSLRASLTRFCR